MIGGRYPAFWIGLAGSIILGVVQTLAGQGVINEVTSTTAVNLTNSVVNLLTLLAPLIAGLVIHTQVTPTSDPSLPMGTSVTTPTGAATVTPAAATIPNPPKS